VALILFVAPIAFSGRTGTALSADRDQQAKFCRPPPSSSEQAPTKIYARDLKGRAKLGDDPQSLLSLNA
jgi:hypothetical protein